MTDQDLTTALNRGLQAHRARRFDEALAHYKTALDQAPDNPEAQSLYGLVLVHLGRPQEGESHLRAAAAKNPGNQGYRNNLADYFRAVGDLDAALAEIDAALAINDNAPNIHERKGDLHFQRREYEAAANAFDKSLQLAPQNYLLALKLASALLWMRYYASALQTLDHAEKINPGGREAADLRCQAIIGTRNWKDLEALARKRTEEDPADAAAWHYLSTALFEFGRYKEAMAALEKAMDHGGRTAERLAQYGKIAIQALDYDAAGKALDEAEKMEPESPAVLSGKALLLTYQGRLKEAEEYATRCIAVDPGRLDVYPQLSVLRKGALTPEEEATLRKYSRDENVNIPARAMASFTLAHSYDARGDIEAAFEEYQNANLIGEDRNAREDLSYDAQGTHEWTSMLIKRFTGVPDGQSNDYNREICPIFIVGLPRSGSTLVESVLAAHSQVEAGGEQAMLPPIFIEWLRANSRDESGVLAPEDREKFLDRYFADAAPAKGAAYLTDKNLLNIEAVGLIAQMFPTAKVLNIRRNPIECGLSIFRNELPKFWTYSNRLDDIGLRYAEYARLTDHFEKAYPERFITIQYEDFSGDFEKEARTMIAACGLEWEDACADFQAARKMAATLSAVQVRSEVSTMSGRAKKYEPYLGPMIDALKEGGVDLETGELISR